VATTFDLEGIKNQFGAVIQSRSISLLLKGLINIHHKAEPKALRTKIAFGLDLAIKARNSMELENRFESRWPPLVAKVMRDRIFLCMAVGIFFMLRKSEHMIDGGVLPTLTRQAIAFIDQNNRPIPYALVNHPGYLADRVFLIIQYSKKDAHGYGRRLVHMRQGPQHRDVCIVQLLERWIGETRDKFYALPTDHIYHVPNVACMKVQDVVDEMKRVTTKLGVPIDSKNKTSSHSLRYGGATMMAAAGFPQYLVAQYGGWSETSDSLKLYTKLPLPIVNQVSMHMVKMASTNCSEPFIQDSLILTKAYSRG
jgi:hypothetical protein